ncbi:universal stress protein [Desulfomicrobium baculatum]|uniref:universal stress protein n=1 Tax=Desulfomicrobium baculatum TaxID=899 RepID=UPI001C54CBBC|nr:universal stress protein [Desulfomicrobium baculatum]
MTTKIHPFPIFLRSIHDQAEEWAKTTLDSAGFEVTDAFIPGDAESIIAQYVRDQEIDMLIMGAYSHSPLRNLFFGSKTSDLLRSAKIPTLLMR